MTRAGRVAGVLSVVAAVALSTAGGCSDTVCDGYVDDEGECRAECVDADCAAGHRCVLGDCRPGCATDADCPASFNCLEAVADDGATRGLFCLQHGYSADGSTGQYVPCAADAECDERRGFSCRHGECRIWGCRTHDDCAATGACRVDAATGDTHCEPDGAPRGAGQYNTRCPFGTECDAAAGFFCQGIGEGDVEGYCMRPGCESDADCPVGYWCETEQGFPCTDRCGLRGNPAFPGCVSGAEFDDPLAAWTCGRFSLQRNACLKRAYCVPCEKDEDCAAFAGQICARDAGGTKICTTRCDPELTNACPGRTSSYCDVHDPELGFATCSHRFRPEGATSFHSCMGTGGACHPCFIDSDCGPNGLCTAIPTTGERFCIDLDFTCTPSGGTSDCPTSPGGVKMHCLTEAEGLTSGSLLYHKCFVPDVDPSPNIRTMSCWPKT